MSPDPRSHFLVGMISRKVSCVLPNSYCAILLKQVFCHGFDRLVGAGSSNPLHQGMLFYSRGDNQKVEGRYLNSWLHLA